MTNETTKTTFFSHGVTAELRHEYLSLFSPHDFKALGEELELFYKTFWSHNEAGINWNSEILQKEANELLGEFFLNCHYLKPSDSVSIELTEKEEQRQRGYF